MANHERRTLPIHPHDRPPPVRRILAPVQAFLELEVSAAFVLLGAAAAALVWANSPFAESYAQLWERELTIGLEGFSLTEDLRHWVNDLLMAFFFFVVGLEIKREFVHGELREPRAALLPVVAAVGGMVVPALVYAAFNAGGPGASGWGVPMATDIAFAVGVLALVGRRAPISLKIFLLALAIVDDLGAIAVIALFYSGGIEQSWLALGVGTILVIAVLQRIGVRSLIPFVLAAAVLWLAVFESGIHATIAGVILGLMTPSRPLYSPQAVAKVTAEQLQANLTPDEWVEEEEEQTMIEVHRLSHEAISPLARLEHRLHPWTAFVVLPLFALANAGVPLGRTGPTAPGTGAIALGIALGLLVGKPVGVVLFSFLAVRLGGARLPAGVGWLEMAGAGMLAGVGFTVAIFITNLAFPPGPGEDIAKVAVLGASALAAVLGAALLALRPAGAGEAS